jgi:hypothetical protein
MNLNVYTSLPGAPPGQYQSYNGQGQSQQQPLQTHAQTIHLSRMAAPMDNQQQHYQPTPSTQQEQGETRTTGTPTVVQANSPPVPSYPQSNIATNAATSTPAPSWSQRDTSSHREPPEKRARFDSSGEAEDTGLAEFRKDYSDHTGSVDLDDEEALSAEGSSDAQNAASSSVHSTDGASSEAHLCRTQSCRRPIPSRSKSLSFHPDGGNDDASYQSNATRTLCDKCVEKIKRRQLKMKQRLKLEPKNRKRGFGAMSVGVS